MAEYYVSMLCRCTWHGPSRPWSIHIVEAPYRYRLLVPWLASFLPVAAPTALALVTYVSLAAYYFLILVSFRRLEVPAGVAVCALALPYVFEAHFVNYYHPFLVEGFSLTVMATMLYAYTIDAFWLFAAAGLTGIFAREMVWFVLPAWCFRDLKRGIMLAGVAGFALLIERNLVWGDPTPYRIAPATIAAFHLDSLSNYARDIRATWGWAFGLTALGIGVLPARAFRVMGPMSLVLFGAALIASFLATDTPRLFGVMTPSVAIAAAALIMLLLEKRHYLLLVSLTGLIVLQFLVTPKNGITANPAAISAIARPIRLGTIWTIVAAFALRRELAASLREKAALIRAAWSCENGSAQPAVPAPRWSTFIAAVTIVSVATAASAYHFADPERRNMDAGARASAPGQFVRLTDGETHFEIGGPQGAPVVVLAAGVGVPYYVWDPTFTALVTNGFRVIRYDYFGRGYSDRPDIAYSQDVYVRQLAELLDALRIAEPVHLAGLAFGGSVITTFADRYPARVQSLVYIAPAFRSPHRVPHYADLAFRRPYAAPDLPQLPIVWDFLTAVFDERAWADYQMADFLHPDRFTDWPQRYRLQMQYRGFRRAQRSTLESNETLDQSEELKRVGQDPRPVIVFWGTQDARVPFESSAALEELMPRARLVPVESGHLAHWERPDVVHPRLVAFLRR
jgi:pimeloyl-ACP methyl ester carboxylesterase